MTKHTTKLNNFPARNEVSKNCSTRVNFHKENIDFKTHNVHYVGDFVQSHEEKTMNNENSTRALEFIYLRPLVDRQEGHDLLHVQISKEINLKKITLVLMSEYHIKKVHSIANDKGIPKVLKKDRNENIYFDSHWNDGVDYHCGSEVSSREKAKTKRRLRS